MGETLSFARPDGGEVPGYGANPAMGGAAPGVVVIQEWWGLNHQIRGVADRLAEAGYRALVPDLYRGKSTVDAEEASHLMTSLNFADAATQDIRGALRHLKSNGRKAAVIGFCMGGALTILTAAQVAEADAAVCFYGVPPPDAYDPSRIRIPLMGHFAEKDAFFPIPMVEALEAKLKRSGASYVFHRYPADHAFCNETRPEVYHEESARLAWARTMDFLKKHLT
ncbi:MAG: dienelactone hydrolase family protein [Planctomycetes bacterium]|nr:dienelactone hydrolase family protein [Planctomycetota bacterium]